MVYPITLVGLPYIPPPPPIKKFRPGANVWTGADGTAFDMGDPRGGIVFTDGGVGGLHMPPFERHTSTSPAIAGNRWRGSRTAERPVDCNILVWSDTGSDEWIERDRSFWNIVGPDKLITWTHESPNGSRRHLRIRYEGGDHSFSRDPHKGGWALYQPSFVAEEPYWFEDAVVRSWAAPEQVDFFDAAGSPDFHISAASTIGSATMPNPGDVAAWPVWTFTGPLTNVSVSVDGGSLGIPDLTEGQTLVVDTDPRRGTARRNGVDVAGLVDPWDPRPVPAGESAPLDIEITGTGTVSVSIVPRYYRAW